MRDEKGRFIKGYKPVWSEESINKLKISMKGVNTWSKGRKLTQEHKEKCKKNASRYWLGKKRPNLTGKLHPNWKEHKISPLKSAIRESFKYKTWRLDVFKRDGYKCQKCFSSQKLEAHHYPVRFTDLLEQNNIITFEDAMKCNNLWDLDSAFTLCRNCHRKTDTWGKARKEHR